MGLWVFGGALAAAQGAVEYLEIANPNPVGSGARALGQGSAFIAIADDATAASWNPAGLAQLETPEFSFAWDFLSRTLDAEGYGDETLSLSDFNYASLVLPFRALDRHMVVSLNYFKMFRFEQEMSFPYSWDMAGFPPFIPPTHAEGATSFVQEGEFSVLSTSYGLDLTPTLSLGVTFNVWNHDITGNSRFRRYDEDVVVTTGGFAGHIYSHATNTYEVDEGYSWVIGGLFRPSQFWTFGAVVKPAYRLDLQHKRKHFRATDGAAPVFGVPLDEETSLNFPLVFGAGIAWRPSDVLTVSLDGTWTQWSQYRYNKASGEDVNPLNDSAADLQDTYTARLGMEYLIVLREHVISLRGGLGYDPAPAVGAVDEYYTVNCGVGVQLGMRVNLDLAYQYKWGHDVGATSIRGLDTTLNSAEHRIMASLICYFQ
jgi:long-subunit fatty acid transport protein